MARRLADEHGRAVRVVMAREDVVRMGPKRPPMAAGIQTDGSGILRVATTVGSGPLDDWVRAVASVAPGLVVEEVLVPGPPVGGAIRGAGWAEATVLLAVPATRSRCDQAKGPKPPRWWPKTEMSRSG